MPECGIGKLNSKILIQYLKFIFNRTTSFIITFSITYFIIVSLIYISPGKQFYRLINPKLSGELVQHLQEMENLSFGEFASDYFIKVIKGDLGVSTRYNDKVSNVVYEHIKVTVSISLIAYILQFILCIIIATYLSQHPNSLLDRLTERSSSIFYSLSTIIIAPVLILTFSVLLKVFPIAGFPSYIKSSNTIEVFFIYLRHLSLPIITLIISLMPMYYKYIREIFYDLSNQAYVIYLKTLGVNKNKIYFYTIIPNSMNMLLSVVGIDLGFLLSGTLITEIIFGIPGLGRLFYEAILSKDYSLTITCAMYAAFVFLFVNLLVDIVRIFLDKRLLYRLK